MRGSPSYASSASSASSPAASCSPTSWHGSSASSRSSRRLRPSRSPSRASTWSGARCGTSSSASGASTSTSRSRGTRSRWRRLSRTRWAAADERVDVVTARTEFYDAPAALPTVEHASIREDLFRRDFTINAMAVSLKGADLGRLVDPFGGRRDLEAKTVRVLHNLSFIDDPTRIFRAIRYENRYGFCMDEHTLRLARGTIEMRLVGDLSSARLRDELTALLEEGELEHSILRLAELAADRAIHPHLAADEAAVVLLGRLTALRDRYGLAIPAWRLGLAVLGLDESPRVGEILAELRRRKLNGELDGRDSELAAARELIAQ